MASRKDYYDILGIRRGATEEEIEKAYQKLARTYQSAPRPGNKTAEFRLKEIVEAYEILSNKARRERYDQMGLELPPPDFYWEESLEEAEEEGNFDGFEDVFGGILGGVEPKAAQPAQRGKDLLYPLEIDFESAVHGAVKEVEILQDVPCIPCAGKGVNPKGPQKVCGQCGGAGQVQIGIPPSAFSKQCGRCDGTGRVRIQPCEICSGRGSVSQKRVVSLHIPPGVNEGCRLYLLRMGPLGYPQRSFGGTSADISAQKLGPCPMRTAPGHSWSAFSRRGRPGSSTSP